MDANRVLKLKVVAMTVVILEEFKGKSIQPSAYRDRGDEWAMDHRRVIIGRRNLFRAKTKRSSSR